MKKNLIKCLLAVTVLCAAGFLFGNGSAFATCTTDSTTGDVTCTESASATVHVAEACTMTATVNTPHIADITNGLYSGGIAEYANGIGKTTLKVICNDASGFSIYAVGYTNNEFGNTKLMTNASDTDAPIINTNTYTSGGTSAWSMKVSPVTGTYVPSIDNSFNSYHSVPSTYTRVAYRTSGTDVTNGATEATGSSVEATYAAYISPTQPAGTYSGQVKYTLVHPASETPLQPQTAQSGCINYFPNGSNVVGTMGCQTISMSDTSATLLASNFSRAGYGFAGWSDKYDYATNASANFYGPQEDITFTAGQYTGSNNGLALYAVWVKSAGNLQDTSKVATLCGTGADALTTAPTDGTANLSSVSALTDQRDNQTYAIAKLADGKCWMIENLRLESTNSDNSTGNLAQGYDKSTTYGNFSGLAGAESTNFSNSTTANSLYYSGTQSGDATVNIGTSNNPGYRMPRYNNLNTTNRAQNNPNSNTFSNDNTTGGMYSYGNYYTWHAAIADLTYNGTNNQSTTGTSLCPTGWHLPTGGSVTTSVNVTETPSTWREFYNLGYGIMGSVANDSNAGTYAYYNNTTTNSSGDTATKAFRKFPNNFLYSGYFNTSSANYRGSYGYYWSSTAYSNYYSYRLSLNSSGVYPGTYGGNKDNGRSIRCTASAGS